MPKGSIPWSCVWPGALGATVSMAAVDYMFPLYLANISSIARLGTSVLFVLIALLWFYALAMILLAGAVVNELRFEDRRAAADAPEPASEPAPAPAPAGGAGQAAG